MTGAITVAITAAKMVAKMVATRRMAVIVATVGMGGLGIATDLRAQSDDGIRLGSFTLSPRLNLTQVYDSNIFEEPDDRTGSFITTVAPQISIESDFSRHRIEANAGARQEFFLQSSDDNSFSFFANAEGIIDVTRRLRILSAVGYRRLVEQRGSDNVDAALNGPVYSDRTTGELRVQYLVSDFRVEPFFKATRRDFIDRGQIVDQDDRDRTVLEGGLEIGYDVATGYEAFLSGSYFDVNFADGLDSENIDQDSNGFRIQTGVRLQLSRLVTGSASGGVVINRHDSPDLSDTTDFTISTALDWTPTRRWNLNLTARRDFEETNVDGASDVVETLVSLGAQYEILRDLDAFARAGATRSSFSGIDRRDTGFFVGTGLAWDVTRQATLRFGYDYLQETSTDSDEEFSKHVVTLGLGYGF